MDTYYTYCDKCPDFYEDATSLKDAQTKSEKHNKEKHKGKFISTFGVKFGDKEI